MDIQFCIYSLSLYYRLHLCFIQQACAVTSLGMLKWCLLKVAKRERRKRAHCHTLSPWLLSSSSRAVRVPTPAWWVRCLLYRGLPSFLPPASVNQLHGGLGVVWPRLPVCFQCHSLLFPVFVLGTKWRTLKDSQELALLCVWPSQLTVLPLWVSRCATCLSFASPVCLLHCFSLPFTETEVCILAGLAEHQTPGTTCLCLSPALKSQGFAWKLDSNLCPQACTANFLPLTHFLSPYFCFIYTCSFSIWKYLRQMTCIVREETRNWTLGW